MDKPELYSRANEVQRQDAKEIINEFKNKFQWRMFGGDRLMDVGCGSADVTVDFLEPILPRDYKEIVATDISQVMLDFAKKTYSEKYPKMHFEQFDIGSHWMPKKYCGHFDHVTSFYCLHWVEIERNMFSNIYQMLAKGGDCLLVYAASHAHYEALNMLAVNEKWEVYMRDVKKFIAPLQTHKNPKRIVEHQLEDAGFRDIKVEIREKNYVYRGNLRGEFLDLRM